MPPDTMNIYANAGSYTSARWCLDLTVNGTVALRPGYKGSVVTTYRWHD